MSDEPEVDEGQLEALSEDEAEDLVRQMCAEGNMPMEEVIEINGHTFTLEGVDHGTSEQASRITGRDDMLTRQLSAQREMLKRAITKIDGRPITPKAMERLIRTAPPALIGLFWEKFLTLRAAQEISVGRMADLVKK